MYSIEEIKEKLSEYGCSIVNDNEYVNITTPLTLEKDGYYTKMCVHNIFYNEKFNTFGTRNPYCVKNMNTYAQRKGIKSKILSVKLITKKNKKITLVEVECGECGDIFTRNWTHLKDSNMLCQKCINKSNSKKQTPKNIEFIKSKGYKILDRPEYINSQTRVLVEDKDGYHGYMNINGIKAKQKMIYFSMFTNKDNYLYNVQNYVKQNNLNIEILDIKIYENKQHPLMLCKCSCGSEFESNIWHIAQGKNRCRACFRRESTRELKIRNFLEENNIEYIQEFKLSDCKDIIPLPFDFWLKDYNILIEIDGEQHEKPTTFGGISREQAKLNFNSQLKRDKIKNDYCKYNNIPLLRINYKDIDKTDNYKNIITSFIHSVQI